MTMIEEWKIRLKSVFGSFSSRKSKDTNKTVHTPVPETTLEDMVRNNSTNPEITVEGAEIPSEEIPEQVVKNLFEPTKVTSYKFVPILVMSPEAYDLPPEMGPMAQYVYRESGGGLGDFSGGLVRGLFKKHIPAFFLTPNYKSMFKRFSGLDQEQYLRKVHTTPVESVILLSSPHFSYTNIVYSSDDYINARSAAHFQDLAIPHIKAISKNNGGRAIPHSNDQYAGGVTNAYCKKRGIPNVHTAHNLMELFIPYEFFTYADLSEGKWGLGELLYKKEHDKRIMIASHATAVKNTDILVFPGTQFGREVIGEKQDDGHYKGKYDDWSIFFDARDLIEEMKMEYDCGQVRFVPNGMSPEQLPENQAYLPHPFGPETKDILAAKKANKIMPEEAEAHFNGKETIDILIAYRMNIEQNGIELALGSMDKILYDNDDVRYIFISDDKTPDKRFENELRHKMSYLRPGRVVFRPFDLKLSTQGYAETDITFCGYKYSPFGFVISQSVAAGSLVVSPYNGGAVDMLSEFDPTNNRGNGFFYDGTTQGAIWNLQRAINTVRELRKNKELYNSNLHRTMPDIRYRFSLKKMVEGYAQIYDELGHKNGLFTDGYKPLMIK